MTIHHLEPADVGIVLCIVLIAICLGLLIEVGGRYRQWNRENRKKDS